NDEHPVGNRFTEVRPNRLLNRFGLQFGEWWDGRRFCQRKFGLLSAVGKRLDQHLHGLADVGRSKNRRGKSTVANPSLASFRQAIAGDEGQLDPAVTL